MQRKRLMRLATWNIQGLRTKQSEVFHELNKMNIDICVLTETKKKGKGNENIGEYIHFYSGVRKDARAKRGVSIAVHKDMKRSIKSWEEIDEQIMTIEIVKDSRHIVIIGVYAPSEDALPLIKDQFYDKLIQVVSNIKKDKEIVILGDLNARTGTENNSTIVGKYGEPVINNNGMRLRDMCEATSMKIMNGFFPHKDIHKFTWEQATKNLRSIIDYIIQKQHSRLNITDVRVYRGLECGSDHHVVMAKIVVEYRRIRNKEKQQDQQSKINECKYNLESLKQESTQFLYKLRLANKLQNMETKNANAEQLYGQIKAYIQEAAKEALGYQETEYTKNPEWYTKKINELIQKKKKAYSIYLNSHKAEDRQLYIYWNREVKKEVKKSKNETWEKRCEEIDRYMGGTKVAMAWKTIGNMRKEEKQNNKFDLIDIREWEEHYKQLLTEERPQFELLYKDIQVDNQEVDAITEDEIWKALQQSKNGKAAGPGNIPIELVKHGPKILHEMVRDLFNRCLLNGDAIPEDWNMAYITSIYKKGDKRKCSNYRGISVTSAMGRLYGRVLKNRIEKNTIEIEEQNGFRAGRSCMDNTFVLQQILEKRKARNLATHLVFIDLEKAYDTVPLKMLFEILTKSDLSNVYVRAIQNIYRNSKSVVKIGSTISEPFSPSKGLRQGCSLSPTLFKIYIQEALRSWRIKIARMGIEIEEKCLTTLFFADDQVIIAGDEDDADYMLRKLDDEYAKWGLNMNMSKTEYLPVGSTQGDPDLQIKRVRRCRQYKYLGSIISDDGTTKEDIRNRVQQGKKATRILNSLLWSDKINLNTKLTIYKAIVEPILTYGCECWQLTDRQEKTIEAVEMDYLRRSCRISRTEHIRNEDIRRRTGRVYTTAERIQTTQLLWYGHVMRMEQDRWPKKALMYQPTNRRRRGRPSRSWKEGIEQTMEDRAIHENEWIDRKVWRTKCGMRQRKL